MRIDTGVLGLPLLDHVHHCRAEDLLCALPDDCIDLIVTSPPYDNLRTYNGFEWSFKLIALESFRVLKPGGVLVWVVGDATIDGSETLSSMRQALYFRDVVGFRMHDTMIYEKDSASFPETTRYAPVFEYMFVLSKGRPKSIDLLTRPNKWAGAYHTAGQRVEDKATNYHGRIVKDESQLENVWRIPTGRYKSTKDLMAFEHTATFPEQLAARHILTWSAPRDIVLD